MRRAAFGATKAFTFVFCYTLAMLQWTERQALISNVAYALRRLRPLLRRIAAEKHPPLDGEPDPALMAAERIVEQLMRSEYSEDGSWADGCYLVCYLAGLPKNKGLSHTWLSP